MNEKKGKQQLIKKRRRRRKSKLMAQGQGYFWTTKLLPRVAHLEEKNRIIFGLFALMGVFHRSWNFLGHTQVECSTRKGPNNSDGLTDILSGP